MKTITLTAIGALLVSPLVVAAPEAAVAPAAAQKEFKSANDVSSIILDEMISIFNELGKVTDLATANKFATSVDAKTKNLTSLVTKLKTFPKPTDAELEQFAIKAFTMEAKVQGAMQGMMAMMMQPENAEVGKIIQGAMGKMGGQMETMGKTLEEYYPEEKMKPFMEKYKAEAGGGNIDPNGPK